MTGFEIAAIAAMGIGALAQAGGSIYGAKKGLEEQAKEALKARRFNLRLYREQAEEEKRQFGQTMELKEKELKLTAGQQKYLNMQKFLYGLSTNLMNNSQLQRTFAEVGRRRV